MSLIHINDKLKHIGHGHYSRKNFQSKRRGRKVQNTKTRAYLLAAGDAAGADEGAGTGVGVAAGVEVDCNTEREPLSVGSASINAISINAAAAPIVILASKLAVPRGPKAVLERLLEKRAPASALPGCKRMLTISTTQERMNKP